MSQSILGNGWRQEGSKSLLQDNETMMEYLSKVIVAGGRDFKDYDLLRGKLDYYLQNLPDIEIVSGGARGADSFGERYAEENAYPLKIFPADWDNLGKRAGFVRNSEMAEYADYLIAFWDGKSRGTKHMIDIAKRVGLKVKVVIYA